MFAECRFKLRLWRRALHAGSNGAVPAAVQEHLQGCPSCREQVADDLAIRELLRASRPDPREEPSIAASVMARIPVQPATPAAQVRVPSSARAPSPAFATAFFTFCLTFVLLLVVLNVRNYHAYRDQRLALSAEEYGKAFGGPPLAVLAPAPIPMGGPGGAESENRGVRHDNR